MNKSNITIIILLSVIIILLLIIMILGILNKNIFSFKINKGKVIFEETYDVKDISLNIDTSSLYIHDTEDSKIKVVVNGGEDDKVEVKNNNILEINYKRKSSFINFGFKNYKIDVYIPKTYENDIEINATTGSVKSETPLKNIKIKVETGSVSLDKVETIEAKVSTGSIKIEEIIKKANISSKTGSIKINKANIQEDSTIKAGTGSIKIEDINDGLYIDAKTQTGSVKNNATSDRFSNVTLKVEATTGSIKIK